MADAGGRLLGGAENASILGDQGLALLAASLAVATVGVVIADSLAQLVDPAAELFEALDHRLDALRAQAEFFDQPHGAAPAAAQPPPGRPTLGGVARLAGDDVVVAAVSLQQGLQRAEIVRQPPQNLVLFQLIGHRHLHGAIEGQLAVVHAAEHLDGRLHDVVAFQNPVTEPGPGKLDLLGQGHFLLPGQQRNLAHLGQIHPHRIVRPRLIVLDAGQQILGPEVQFRIVLFVVVQDGAVQDRPRRPMLRPDHPPVPASRPPGRSVRPPSRPTMRRTKCCSSIRTM